MQKALGSSSRRWLAAAVLWSAVVLSHAQQASRETVAIPSVGANTVSATSGVLLLPGGPGPFAAVVVIHGCGGVLRNSWDWAGDLVRAGYAALVVDHFRPRGIERICERTGGKIVELRERRSDTYSALHYLASRPEIDQSRIALLGFSHGAMTVINALVPGLRDPAGLRFKTGVALYPDCTWYMGLSLSAPLLVLVGEKDDWTPAPICQQMVARLPAGSQPARVEVYPGAHHAFDDADQRYFYISAAVNAHARFGYGATVEYNAEAHARARQDALKHFDAHLGRADATR